MNFNKLNTFTASLTISLVIIVTIFISPITRADDNNAINKNTVFDEKLSYAESIRSSKPKQFSALIKELNQYSNQITRDQQYQLNYLNLYLLMYQGSLAEAITSSKVLLNSDADSLLKYKAKLALINIFSVNQNWAEGLSTVSSLLTELPSIKDKKKHLPGLILTAMFYNQLGQYNLSLYYAKQVESASTNGRDQCFAKGEIIKSSFELKTLTPTDPKIKHTISLCRINNEHLIISLINSYVAKVYLEKQQQEQALALLNSGLQDTLNTKYPRIIAEYYSLFAQAHWLNNEKDLTKKFALQALKHEKEEGTTVAKILSYKLLFEVAQAESNFESALLFHQKYAIADKLHYGETQAKHLAFQLAEHKALEQKNQIYLLNKQNTLLTTEKALNKANTENTRLIIIVLVISLSVLTFWGVRLLLAHKRIKELAEYDALTGIFNRGHFTQVANDALEYCQSAEQTLSLIMFDLDNFKRVNDSYGHACGDWALKKAVDVCKEQGRMLDIFARLGGEEFCILLTSCDKVSAFQRAEACRHAIANINTAESGYQFTLTASFGITDTDTSGYDLEKLLADADTAAYSAKDFGRNKITTFYLDTPEEPSSLDGTQTAL